MHLEVFRIASKWKLSFKVKPGFPILSNTKALHTKILYLALFINFNMDHVMSPVMEEISGTYIRSQEHIGVSPLIGKRVKEINNSAVCDHLFHCNCLLTVF